MSFKKRLLIGLAIFAAYAAYVLIGGTSHTANFIVYICLFIIAGQGWNLLGGYVGEISFGHAVFFGIGAYTIGLSEGYGLGIPIAILVVLAPIISALFALIMSYPLLRIRGFSFLIGTFGLGVIFLSVFKNSEALFSNKGIFISSVNPTLLYLVIAAVTVLTVLFVAWLVNKDIGLRFIAVRDAPEAAEMIGINIYRTKTVALVIGAAIAGLAGGLYALYSLHVTPAASFDSTLSNSILLGSYIGGCGTIMGPVVGGFILIALQEWARGAISVTGGHNLVLGILLIVVMMTMKEGIWPTLVKLFKGLGSDILGNPITILDTSYKRLAASSNLAAGDNKLIENVKIGYMDEQTIRLLKTSKRLSIICQSQYPVVSGPSTNHEHGVEVGYGWIDSSVKINGTVVAYFAVYGINKPFGENDAEYVNQLVKLTSIELQKNEHFIQNHGVMYESLLVDLIEQRLTDQKIIINRLRSLDKTLDEELYTVIAQKENGEKTNFQFSSGTQSSLRMLIKDSISVCYKQEIVLLVSRRKGEALFSNTEDNLLSFLEQNELRMGISNVFSNPAEMHKYYFQSKKSLELSRRLSEKRIEYYSDYVVFHALEICAENIDLRDFCHPGLLKMIESHEPSDQELVQTLYLYLFYMKDIPRITNELHIHKNTLFYRLKKIKAMINEEFDDGNAVFNLMFSFKLKEYVKSFLEMA
ncbi:MAG: helix-turn-helix domain-containing protein [Oscillospiraceae bacterium]|nr:helix-turn-helix domain-containing protein [Oscillospiraceae bacterium]